MYRKKHGLLRRESRSHLFLAASLDVAVGVWRGIGDGEAGRAWLTDAVSTRGWVGARPDRSAGLVCRTWRPGPIVSGSPRPDCAVRD